MKKLLLLALALGTLLVMTDYASATPYGFYSITNNSAIDAAIGESQLRMEVTDASNGQVQFYFTNVGSNASSITDIYFQDEVPLLLYADALISQTSGVIFSPGASPPNVPGWQDADFVVAQNGSYDSDSPTQPNGVNPGEWLQIVFSLAPSYEFYDVISALDNESFRVGLHVQGFEGEGSEGFVNTPVPEPGTMLLLGAGFLGLAIYGKRRRNS